MSSNKTLYAMLGIEQHATPAEIEAAYLAVQRSYGETLPGPERDQKMAALDKAYELLANPVRRRVYDASLAAGQAGTLERGINPGTPTPAGRDSLSRGGNLGSGLGSVDVGRTKLILKLAGLIVSTSLIAGFYYFQGHRQQHAFQPFGGKLQEESEMELLNKYTYDAKDPLASDLLTSLEAERDKVYELETLRNGAADAKERGQYTEALLKVQQNKQAIKQQLRQRLGELGQLPVGPDKGR